MGKVQSIKLSEYSKYPYSIPNVQLEFQIYDDYVLGKCQLDIRPLSNDCKPLVLQGKDLELIEISIEGQPLERNQYKLREDNLIVENPPSKSFSLSTSFFTFANKTSDLNSKFLKSKP